MIVRSERGFLNVQMVQYRMKAGSSLLPRRGSVSCSSVGESMITLYSDARMG